ncbi:ATP-binding protein [Vogesella indigofera]|uniref:ATP-binding protein n=1 Tax=Vogesella indigofera TaxID=45465 RepID=UPI0014735B95|nr:ATP-binding protein [Vogesella indigofera]
MITTKTFLQAVRQHGGAKWLFWALCLLLCYALAAQLAGYRQQTFDQALQLNQTLLRRQLDYTALLLQQLTPTDAAGPQALNAELPAFVVAAGFQHKIDTGSRDAFEVQQSYRRRALFLIREYRDQSSDTWTESSAWFPAPARSHYIPLTNLSPDRPGGRLEYLQGLDLAADRFFAAAIKTAISSGEIQASKPFTYRDGAPGLAFVRAAYTGGVLPDTTAERLSQVSGVAVVFVDLRQLLPLPENSPLQLSISAAPDMPQLASVPAAGVPFSALQTLRQTLLVPDPALPYVLQLSLPAAGWLPWLLFGGALLGSGMLSRRLFRSPAPAGEPALPPVAAPQPLAALEHIALQAMDEAVLLLSARNQVLYANARAMALTGDAALQGKLLDGVDFGICYPRNQRRVHVLPRLIEKKVRAMLPPGSILIDAHGQECEIEGEFIPLNDAANVAVRYLLSFRHVGKLRQDMVAALKASEMQLKKHQDELARVARINTLGEMSSGVAHEINQPLSAIMSYNEACLAMMDDANPDPVLLRISLVSSVRQANRAGQIIRRLRELASRKQPEVAPLNINDALRSALDLTKNELAAREVIVTTDLAEGLPQVMADSIQLEQVIINLIKNAVDAMTEKNRSDEPMRIFAYSERRGRHIRLGIRDNGTGIPENILPHVFDPFYSSKSEGMGLGLTISQTIIESIGGRLAARNLETGGAEFSLTVPVLKNSHPDAKEEQQ